MFECDFFEAREPAEIRDIFHRIGVDMSDDFFQQMWSEAVARDANGDVQQ